MYTKDTSRSFLSIPNFCYFTIWRQHTVPEMMRSNKNYNEKLFEHIYSVFDCMIFGLIAIDCFMALSNLFNASFFGFFLDLQLSNVALTEGNCLNPSTCTVIFISCTHRCHIINTKHIAMRNQHVHSEIQDAGIEFEERSNAPMDHPIPLVRMLYNLCGLKTDTISFSMLNLSNLIV